MSLFLSLIISIAVNLDNLLIGMSLGLKGRRLSLFSNIIIASVTFVLTFIASGLTWFISEQLQSTWQAVGALFLIFFGFYCLVKNKGDEFLVDKYKSLSVAQSIFLGLVLSINCIPPALSAGMLGIHPLFISLFAGFVSLCAMYFSNRFSYKFVGFKWSDKVSVLSNILLIMTGIIEILLLRF